MCQQCSFLRNSPWNHRTAQNGQAELNILLTMRKRPKNKSIWLVFIKLFQILNQHLNKYPNTYEVEIPRLWYHNVQKQMQKNEEETKKWTRSCLTKYVGSGFHWFRLANIFGHIPPASYKYSTCKLLKNLVRDNSFFWEGGITLHTKKEQKFRDMNKPL